MADLLREDLMKRADDVLVEYDAKGIPAMVFFKVTCPNCGERVIFREPNTWHDSVECVECGVTSDVDRGGFMLVAGTGIEVFKQLLKEEAQQAHSS